MKSFKIISFNIINNDERKINLPLIDGITINQENDEQSWILEVFLDGKYKETFENFKNSNEDFDVQVVISFSENEPAPFTVKVIDILQLEDHISVLMKGKIKLLKQKYAEQLLINLLEENLSKDELLKKFAQGMKERPTLKK